MYYIKIFRIMHERFHTIVMNITLSYPTMISLYWNSTIYIFRKFTSSPIVNITTIAINLSTRWYKSKITIKLDNSIHYIFTHWPYKVFHNGNSIPSVYNSNCFDACKVAKSNPVCEVTLQSMKSFDL